MPYMQSLTLDANALFAPSTGLDGPALVELIGDAQTVSQVVANLGLIPSYAERHGAEHAAALEAFLATLPPSTDRALVAAVRSSLERGLPTQFTWRPGAAVELQTWETSRVVDGTLVGMTNIVLVSPEPPEPGLS